MRGWKQAMDRVLPRSWLPVPSGCASAIRNHRKSSMVDSRDCVTAICTCKVIIQHREKQSIGHASHIVQVCTL